MEIKMLRHDREISFDRMRKITVPEEPNPTKDNKKNEGRD